MAKKWYKNYGKKNSSKKGKRKSKYSDLEKMAYKWGQISKGLEDDTLVRDSFNNGYNGPAEKPPKKRLF